MPNLQNPLNLPNFPELPQRVRLSYSGDDAELTRDDLTENGVVLSIGGAEQSHVELGDPSYLLHDYTYRMGAILRTVNTRLFSSDDGPRTVLHLGAGALTLPRWITHYWPQAEQTVVDIEPELVEFVLEYVPMHPAPENIVADAATLFAEGELAARQFDLIIVDLFNSSSAPDSLVSREFFESVLGALTGSGMMLMNLGDDAGMEFARRLVATILDALREVTGVAGSAVRGDWLGCALLAAPESVIAGVEEGNLVLAITPSGSFEEVETNAIWGAGPHPGDVLTGSALAEWAQ